MRKKIFQLLLLTASVLFFQSCGEDDPYANLSGRFNLSKAFVDGVGTSGGGFITFNPDKTATLEVEYRIDVTTFSIQGTNIPFTATDLLLTLNPGTATEQKWNRGVDESDEQEIDFNQIEQGKTRNVILEFKK